MSSKSVSTFQFSLLLIISTFALVLSGFSVFKLAELEHKDTQVEQTSLVDQMFTQYGDLLNQRIDGRINSYIDRKREEAAKMKFAKYDRAPDSTSISNKKIYGNENARFTLVEYSDFECPFCKRYHQTPKQVVDSSNGAVNWQFKHLPLPFHDPAATVEAVATECAYEFLGNRGFWVFADQIFANTRTNGEGVKDLFALGEEIGIPGQDLNECIKSGRHLKTVQQDLADAKAKGYNSTPITLVVDNETGQTISLRGAQDPNAVASAISRLRKQSDLAAR